MGFHFINNPAALPELARLEDAPVLGLDIEVAAVDLKAALNPRDSKIRLIQLASETDTFVIDLFKVDPMDRVRPLLVDDEVVKVIHNAKFEVKHFLHHQKLVIKNLFCTYLASRLLAMGKRRSHKLSDVVDHYLQRPMDKTLQKSDWSGDLTEEQVQYAALDAEVLVPLHHIMAAKLSKHRLNRVSKLEFRTVVPVAAMELAGAPVDEARLDQAVSELQQRRDILEQEVLQDLKAGDSLFEDYNTLNLNAPEQVKNALHDLGLHVPDTTDHTLKPLAATHPYVQKLLEFRHVGKLLSSSVLAMKHAIHPATRRIHSTYHQIASASGRFACSDPNIQQVPRERKIRACVRPEPGRLFVIADYSQVELRVAAGLSKDPIMMRTYHEGGDLHKLTAALTMGKQVERVTKEQRQAAKAINFGLIYAMGAKGLQGSAKASYGVDMSLEEATTFRDRYFQHYRGIARWQKELEREGKRRGYTRTAAGRIRSYRGEEIRVTELLNTPVQGTAAEGLKSAMCIFWDQTQAQDLDAVIIAVIHDEIIVDVREDQAEVAKTMLESSMIKGIQWLIPDVRFEADAHIATSWAEK